MLSHRHLLETNNIAAASDGQCAVAVCFFDNKYELLKYAGKGSPIRYQNLCEKAVKKLKEKQKSYVLQYKQQIHEALT